jgi:hypothetical protein
VPPSCEGSCRRGLLVWLLVSSPPLIPSPLAAESYSIAVMGVS